MEKKDKELIAAMMESLKDSPKAPGWDKVWEEQRRVRERIEENARLHMGPKPKSYWTPLIQAVCDEIIDKYGYATRNLLRESDTLAAVVTDSHIWSELIGHVIKDRNEDAELTEEFDYVTFQVPNRSGGIIVLTIRVLTDAAKAEIQRLRKDKDADAQPIFPKDESPEPIPEPIPEPEPEPEPEESETFSLADFI